MIDREDLGEISVGKAADFFLVNLNRIDMVGAQFALMSVLCTVGWKGSVDYTVVNGHIVVKKGRLVRMDEEYLVQKANEAVTDYLNN